MDCIFCKIVAGEIHSIKITETPYTLVFMDAFPLSTGHTLFIPKKHTEKLHEVDDKSLAEIPGLIKQVALAGSVENYNVLQNNGRIAHQAVPHVHFHMIPKPDENQGMGIIWNSHEGLDQKGFAEKVRETFS